MDLATAEATAKLINENKINPGLLELLFDPGPKKLGPPPSEIILSGENLPAIESLRVESDQIDSKEARSKNTVFRNAGNGLNGVKKPFPKGIDHRRTPSTTTKQKKTSGPIRNDHNRGLVEPTRPVINNVAMRKPREIASKPINRREDKKPSIESEKTGTSESATSRRGKKSYGTRSKLSCEPQKLASEKRHRQEKGEPKDRSKSARGPQPTVHQDSMGSYPSSKPLATEALAIGQAETALTWAYATYTEADEALLDAGVWLWERPRTYFYPHLVSIKMSDPNVLAPVVVSHESTGTPCPLIEYSGEIVHIIPHEEPWEDVRSIECHPDYLPPCKLVEYQACEAAGYYIWRHDRNHLLCRKPDCDALVMDHCPSSVFCLGCGPKTIVRYCSFQHQTKDIDGHWTECGDPDLVMPYVIDHATAPDWFLNKPPAIAEKHGKGKFKSAKLHRQKMHFMNNGGYYTLFNPITHDQKRLSWSKTELDWQELDARIERLLNIAFLGGRNHGIIGYIYSMLRALLCSRGEWDGSVHELLKAQIRDEFQDSSSVYDGFTDIRDEMPSDCEWTGRDYLPHGHFSQRVQNGIPTIGPQSRSAGFRLWVEQMENKYWILRAWRQQHPTEKDWRVRANGYGVIPLKPGEEVYQLGPGWTGWGGREGNVRGPDWALDQEL